MIFKSTKTFGHNLGLSACFRQHRADSHCKKLHGYALEIKLTFASHDLDVRNWVVDFGSLKSLKARLEDTFDHRLLVAQDDPMLDNILALGKLGLADVVVVESTGCEAFAKLIFESTEVWLHDAGYSPRCWVQEVEVREHGANSALYSRDCVIDPHQQPLGQKPLNEHFAVK
jgi:6-pyruvoyltetrahydropterin/6-carboxytetrahydropterin synthase